MLKLVPNATFPAKVTIPVPGEEKDKVIKVHFKFLQKEELNVYLKSLEDRSDLDALKEVTKGWETKDGEGYEGVDTEFNESNLAALLNAYVMAPLAFFEAFRDELTKAKQGN